jgi:hypothetical protein
LAREVVYQYNGKVNLRDDPELIDDSTLLPAPDTLVKRKDINYRVTSVSVTRARQPLPRFIVNLVPTEESPPHRTIDEPQVKRISGPR